MGLRITRLDPAQHDRQGFHCGTLSLDVYLRERAGQHQRDGVATTHVLFDNTEPSRILGYCALVAAQLELRELQPVDRKRLPRHPVPAIRIARLAVSEEERGKGHGRLLVGHAVNCSLELRGQLGVKVIAVDALNDRAAGFYRAYGFRETSSNAHMLYLPLGKG